MDLMESIKAKLNYMTILDLKENYNKNEIERIVFVNNNDEIKKIKKEIENMLYSIYDKNEYDIMVGCNHITINKIISKNENSLSLQEYKKIWSDNFEKLPYAYVMGKKISKKDMEYALENMI